LLRGNRRRFFAALRMTNAALIVTRRRRFFAELRMTRKTTPRPSGNPL